MGKSEQPSKVFSALEVANLCGVVNQTAINWIKQGHLAGFTTPGGQYRVYSEDLVKFLKKRNMKIPESLQDMAAQKALLIVDDDETINNLLKNLLEKKFPQISIYQAFDGFEAGRRLAEISPVIIILDIDLPGIDGYQLCRKIKEDRDMANPWVISITGLSVEEKNMSDIGSDAFFSKPFDFEQLVDVVSSFLKGMKYEK
jgi:two-component system OmpR family response regulator